MSESSSSWDIITTNWPQKAEGCLVTHHAGEFEICTLILVDPYLSELFLEILDKYWHDGGSF